MSFALKASTFILAACAISDAAIVARQSQTTLDVVQGGTTLGAIYVDPSTGTPVVSSLSSTPFYTDSGFLYAGLGGSADPHAFVSFENFGTACGSTGPLVFAGSDTNKCSQQATFSFSDDGVLTFSTAGSFEVCGADNHIAYNTDPSSLPSGCVNVDIVEA